MGLQKYRADYSEPQTDGSTQWLTRWMGGPTLARINNCRVHGSNARRAVYITGEACTWFSVPAACVVRGKTVRGYVTSDGDERYFRPLDSHKHLLD